MALRYNFLVAFVFLNISTAVAYDSVKYQMLQPKGVQLLYKAAFTRYKYKKLAHRCRPRWSPYYLASLFPLAPYITAKLKTPVEENLEEYTDFSYQVRVLLEEVPRASVGVWKLSCNKGILVKKGMQGEVLNFPHTVTIEYRNGILYVNKHKISADRIAVEPRQGYLHLNGNDYDGSMLFSYDKKKGYCMSQLDIESYIASVLSCESWPGWPIEVNKAFAIGCRSYLVAKIAVAARKGLPFHIKNTNIHQTYNGVQTSPELIKAVQETKGIILTYDKKPIDAMFDSCCGGVIPAHISGVNFEHAPYLKRTYPCHYCKPCKIYNWKAQYAMSDLAPMLRKAGIKVGSVDSIEVSKLDKAGLVTEVLVKDGKKRIRLTGKQCYALFGKVNSFCFTIQQEHKNIVITGRGYGHHLGICQWGARRMLDHGATYRDILNFYYPHTEYMKLAIS